MKRLFCLFPAELEHFNYDTCHDGLAVYKRLENIR